MDTKVCKGCSLTLPVENFYTTRPSAIDGRTLYHSRCKPCHNKQLVDGRRANPERYNSSQRQYGARTNPGLAGAIRAGIRAVARGKRRTSKHLLETGLSTAEELRRHLLSTYPGARLTYGGFYSPEGKRLEIDHIISLSLVNLKDPNARRVAVHFSNLRLVTRFTNSSSGGSLNKGKRYGGVGT